MNPIEVVIPVAFILVTAVVVVTFLYLSHKNKMAIQETIRRSLDQGNSLTPELLEKLGTTPSPRVKDLRRGIVLAALGLAAILSGLVVNDSDGMIGFVIAGLFPLMMGSGFLLVWKLNRYND
ncbi:DUF6249 domain-containing protein [Pleionea sediminis]|uniref:DUF6249 domain-containing protein n=1 Tax=Pleionea sediminis TaxID=2569479 RepID=UPI001186998C|nr:DUF6249 domain-containing protein [Pleionea sediminis]